MSENPVSAPAEPDLSREALCFDVELVEVLYDLLYRSDLGQEDLTSQLATLEAQYGNAVYAEILYIVSHLRFEEGEAKRHWIMISGHRDSMQRRLCAPVDLRVALVSYFLDVDPQFKNPKIIELQTFEKTRACAYKDELTRLCNYRLFKEHLEREIHRVDRYNQPLSLVMIDVDDFKNYNDHNGHEAGNEVLAMLAQLVTATLRKVDVAARYGGEEFALILPSTDKAGAQIVAERARLRIAGHPFAFRHHQPGGRLTVSMGIATCPSDAKNVSDLIRCADRAMYAAKARGKNQVHVHGDDRRSFRRIDAMLDGECCVLAAEVHALKTVNISENGLLFHIDRHLLLGTVMRLKLMLPEADREIEATGRVVRVEDRGDGRYEAALKIVEINVEDQHLLGQYVQQCEAQEDAGEEAQMVQAEGQVDSV